MIACGNYPDLMEPTRTKITPAKMHAWRAFLTAHAEVIDALGKDLESAVGLPLTWYEVLLHLEESDGGRLRMHEPVSYTHLRAHETYEGISYAVFCL